MRECGLKLISKDSTLADDNGSLPVRECGLKQHREGSGIVKLRVTPRAGVWIETRMQYAAQKAFSVTPRAGVWIETGRR